MPTDLAAPARAPRVEADAVKCPLPCGAASPGQSRRLRRCAELTGLDLLCVDAESGVVLEATSPRALPLLPVDFPRLASAGVSRVTGSGEALMWGTIPLPDETGAGDAVAVALAFRPGAAVPPEVVLEAVARGWSQEELDEWDRRQPRCTPEFLERVLAGARRQLDLEAEVEALRSDATSTTGRLERTFDEASLLHGMAQNLQISRSPLDLADLCLSRLHPLVEAEGCGVWIEAQGSGSQFLVRGTLPFDEIGLAQLVARFDNHDWSLPLVRNQADRTLLGADFPGLRNLIIVPISCWTHRAGWIVCCNLPHGREFGGMESGLLNSVATMLGTHVHNIDLFQQYHELILSFVRSLVSTLDAKDPYTRGHSERVALIARRLGRQLNLPDEDLQDVYLSGLLHDIGKIGVDDRILQKPGQLSNEEFRKIQQHPMIGYSILLGLKNLRPILPGVRNHHEAYNGKGYPDGLKGEQIPLMARIIAVADAYDAMGSDRPYRPGMALDTLEGIFRRGAGEQWDKRVIDAYFECRDDICRICRTYSPGDGNLIGPDE